MIAQKAVANSMSDILATNPFFLTLSVCSKYLTQILEILTFSSQIEKYFQKQTPFSTGENFSPTYDVFYENKFIVFNSNI